MDCRLILLAFLSAVIVAAAAPGEETRIAKRDVMESMKSAWEEVVKTLSNAGDAVVHVFKPTEKSVMTKITDVLQPTEKGFLDKVADGIRN